MNGRLLVVGGTGRTGRHVVRQARERGHEVAVLCRDPARVPPEDAGAVQVFVGDARRVDDLVPALDGRDAVIAILTPDAVGATTINSDATLAILGALRRTGPARIVLASARPVVASRPAL